MFDVESREFYEQVTFEDYCVIKRQEFANDVESY